MAVAHLGIEPVPLTGDSMWRRGSGSHPKGAEAESTVAATTTAITTPLPAAIVVQIAAPAASSQQAANSTPQPPATVTTEPTIEAVGNTVEGEATPVTMSLSARKAKTEHSRRRGEI